MTGKYKIRISNSRNRYTFELKRNITILCGDSGKGKTTLYEMVREYNRFKKNSGVSISCDREVIALDGDDWETRINQIGNAIIIIDEDSKFIRTKEFARAIRESDNYYLLVTRNYLPMLPYSVDEIYELSGDKNKKFVPVYNCINRMFDHLPKRYLPFAPEIIITEDSNAGFDFFAHVTQGTGIECISAHGKSEIFRLLPQYADKDTLIIADGAAFGSEMSSVIEQQKLRPRKIAIFLPESFEWLILSAGVIKEVDIDRIENTFMYADSNKFFSWEQYFTFLLEEVTKNDKVRKYSKKRLSPYYRQDRVAGQITGVMKDVVIQGKKS